MLTAATGTISGFKFFDENANGTFDSATESTSTAGAVFIDLNANGVCDAGEPAASDFGPTFSFTGLAPGTYTLRSAGTSESVQPSGAPSNVGGAVKQIMLKAGVGVDGVAFGYTNRGGHATVNLFEDQNRDGRDLANEPGVTRGAAAYLDLNNDTHWQPSEPIAQGLADGTTNFYNLSPGTYVMRPMAGVNWVPASPGQSATVTIGSPSETRGSGGVFGFLPTDRPASVSGFAYTDNNGNGSYDNGDTPAGLNEALGYWDTNNNGSRDTGEPFGVSGFTGYFAMNVVPGFGRLGVESGRSEKIRVSQPTSGYLAVTAVANKVTSGGVFGIVPLGGISGTVYEDTNSDGAAEPTVDKEVSGTVVLDENANGRFDPNEPSATLVGGRYYLSDIPAGPREVLILQSAYGYPEKPVTVVGHSTATLNFLLTHPLQTTGSRFIDAGGPAAGAYSADSSFTGGTTYSSTAAINTAAVASPAPQAVYQTERYGNFSYNLAGLVAGKQYTVTLHFDELYWTAAGKRVFNVTGNGAAWLTNFDVFAAAGGKNKAITRSFSAFADNTGKITITFAGVKDNAKVNAIDVVANSYTQPLVPAATFINAGGVAVGQFSADTGYGGGKTYSTTATVDTSLRAAPAPAAAYQSERYGNFSYTLQNLVVGQHYLVELDFAETYWNAANQRLFNILINGQTLVTNYDIFVAAGGKNKASGQGFDITPDSSGKITITFVSVKDNAKVSAIQVIPVPGAGTSVS